MSEMLRKFSYSQEHLVKIQPNAAVDSKLTSDTLAFLHCIGLRNSEAIGFNFTGKTFLLPHQVIEFEGIDFKNELAPSGICLDTRQGGIIRWKDHGEDGFINSSVEQFVQCVEVFEHYVNDIEGKEVFGPIRGALGFSDNRIKYVAYLKERFQVIDPAVFERRYYWPSFIEQIEQGLL